MVGFIKSALSALGIKGKEGAANISLEEFLNELPHAMGYDVSFNRKESDEKGICFEVEGEEADSFLGDSSDMLDALAHISMRVVRRSEGIANAPAEEGQEALRVIFDSQGFRERKRNELQELAAAQRQRVVESGGKPAYIPALGPSERKIIHTHLAELGEVVSESIGRGNFKRIRVRLKEDSEFRRAPEPRPEGQLQASPGNGNGASGGQRRGNGSGGGGGRGRSGGRGRGGGGQGRGRDNFGGGSRPGIERGNEIYNNDGPVVDDNIGNRLLPGEEPAFRYGSANGGENDDGFNDKN